tara:strand:- start:1071 stop:1337 length:267 start_codon:yes stop_codon:yes gene_type:complete
MIIDTDKINCIYPSNLLRAILYKQMERGSFRAFKRSGKIHSEVKDLYRKGLIESTGRSTVVWEEFLVSVKGYKKLRKERYAICNDGSY